MGGCRECGGCGDEVGGGVGAPEGRGGKVTTVVRGKNDGHDGRRWGSADGTVTPQHPKKYFAVTDS